jgi:NADH-quinone oxidoreductase subunit N
MPTWNDVLPLTPELFLLGATCAILLIDLFLSPTRRGMTHFLAVGALIFTAVLTLRPQGALADGQTVTAFGGMFIRDSLSDVLKMAIYLTSIAVFTYAKPYLKHHKLFQGEYYALSLFGVLGMMLMVSAGNLLTLYLGLEMLALCSYALVALNRDSSLSSEAAMKYFVLAALASGMLLYGMSMIYGATGTLDLNAIHGKVAVSYDRTLVAFGLTFIVVGIAFKFGAAPFHMWVPDVYQGSPTAVTLFIASAPKIAAFGMAYRLLEGGLSGMEEQWRAMLAVLAVLSLAIGNIVALVQTNLKRMLAYSTISHVGFLLLGILNGEPAGHAAAMFYAMTYAITTAAAFGMIVLLSRAGFEAEEIDDFRGLNRRNSWYALVMLMIMASLAGVPIWVGFVAKLQVLKAALDADLLWLVLSGAVFAVIGAFYYLRIIKVMYFDEPAQTEPLPLPADMPFRFVLSANGFALLALGIFSGPLMTLCLRAVHG